MGRSDDFEHLGRVYEDEREYLTTAHEFIEDGLVAWMHVGLEPGTAELPTNIGGSAVIPMPFSESAAA